MARHILFILIFLTSFSLFGQFSYSPTPLVMSFGSEAFENVLDFHINNAKDSTYTIYWKLEKDQNTWPSVWESKVCDKNTCYLANNDMCPISNPNIMGQGSTLFQLHVNPNGEAGSTILVFRLFSDKDFKNEVFKTKVYVNSAVSTKNSQLKSDIRAYPNPASDYFSISNNQVVKKLVIYNMFGKEVKSFFHYNNAEHEISDIKTGMYIVKMFDEKNRLVKTVKLNKVSGGA
ncbi:MAG: T9SS type A sorting domain-containing protein [Saprospiraceae bacterium]